MIYKRYIYDILIVESLGRRLASIYLGHEVWIRARYVPVGSTRGKPPVYCRGVASNAHPLQAAEVTWCWCGAWMWPANALCIAALRPFA